MLVVPLCPLDWPVSLTLAHNHDDIGLEREELDTNRSVYVSAKPSLLLSGRDRVTLLLPISKRDHHDDVNYCINVQCPRSTLQEMEQLASCKRWWSFVLLLLS